MTHSFAVLLLFPLGLLPQFAGDSSASFCECLTLKRTVDGLERLGGANWRRIDRSTLEELWPRVPVLPCEAGTQVGLEASADYLARCCEACELCGGAAFDEGGTTTSLRMVDLWVSRESFESVRLAFHRLIRSVLPGASKPTSRSESESRVVEGYSWSSEGLLFNMRTDAIASGSVWVGNFQVGTCSPEDIAETWQLDERNVIRVLSATLQRLEGARAALSFSYVTECVLEDRSCHRVELDRLWPKLRSMAVGRTITAIEINAETCLGRSVEFEVTRSKEGKWIGGLWTPKTR